MIRILGDCTLVGFKNMSNGYTPFTIHTTKDGYYKPCNIRHNVKYHTDKKVIYDYLGIDSVDSYPNIECYTFYNNLSGEKSYYAIHSLVTDLMKFDLVITDNYGTYEAKTHNDIPKITIVNIYCEDKYKQEVYMNDMKVELLNDDVRLTVKELIKEFVIDIINNTKCQSDVVDNQTDFDRYQTDFDRYQNQLDQLNKLVIDQNAKYESMRLVIVKSLGFDPEAESLRCKEYEAEIASLKSTIAKQESQLEEYKKSIIEVKNRFSTLGV